MVFSPVSYNQKKGLAFQKCIQDLQWEGNRMVTEAGRRPELREWERKEGYQGKAVLNAISQSPQWRKWKGGRSEAFLKCRAPHGSTVSPMTPAPGPGPVQAFWEFLSMHNLDTQGMSALLCYTKPNPSMPHWGCVPRSFIYSALLKINFTSNPDVHL